MEGPHAEMDTREICSHCMFFSKIFSFYNAMGSVDIQLRDLKTSAIVVSGRSVSQLFKNKGLQSHTGSTNARFRVIYPLGLQRGEEQKTILCS